MPSAERYSIKIILPVLLTALIIPASLSAQPESDLRGWEYRWGDSPVDREGTPVWIIDENGTGWLPAPQPLDPPGRGENSILWLRVRLEGKKISGPAAFLDCVLHNFEAYHRGGLVYRFGDVSPGHPRDFRGRPWHIVPLGDSYEGTRLYLRIRSFDSHIGIPGSARLGPYSGHIIGIIRDDLLRASISLMSILAGAIALAAFAWRREDRAVLAAGCSLVLVGIWNIANSRIKLVFLNDPILWLYAEHASLYCLPAAIGMFMEQVFGRGPGATVRRGWQFLLAYAVIALGASAFDPYWLRAWTLRPFQVLLAIYLVAICVITAREALRGDLDARIIAFGLFAAMALGLYDIVISLMELSFRMGKISHWGMVIFIATTGIVLDRRLRVTPVRILNFTARQRCTAPGKTGAGDAELEKRSAVITPDIREKLDRVLAYLDEHYTGQISREGLAGYVSLNHDYLGKMFLLYTGKKIGAYINEHRIKMAADLLVSGDTSIIDVAFAVGFESLSTFYRTFQYITGLSPIAYRERFKNSVNN